MDITIKKLALIELLLKTNEEEILDQVRDVFKNTSIEANMLLKPVHYEILNERRAKHLNEESASYSWDEIKADIDSKK